MAQEEIVTGSRRVEREPRDAWGVESEARAVEAEGRAEEFQGRLMSWLSGGWPPAAFDLEKLRSLEDVAGVEAAMLTAAQLSSIIERLDRLEAALIALRESLSKAETEPDQQPDGTTKGRAKKGEQ